MVLQEYEETTISDRTLLSFGVRLRNTESRAEDKRLGGFDHRCLRSVVRTEYSDRVRNN